MIRISIPSDYDDMFRLINDSAQVYEGVIPADCWKQPYMPMEELVHEIRDGVNFWVYERDKLLLGVMGIQDRGDVTLIRHAYVLTQYRRDGIGTMLLKHLMNLAENPVLIGTWKDAVWAVKFYEKNGFTLVSDVEKDRLLKKYWKISARQIETSVVLVDGTFVQL